MVNKSMFNVVNDNKKLHKVGKQWVAVSALTLALIGGGMVASHNTVNANADTLPTTHPNAVQVNGKSNQPASKPNNQQNNQNDNANDDQDTTNYTSLFNSIQSSLNNDFSNASTASNEAQTNWNDDYNAMNSSLSNSSSADSSAVTNSMSNVINSGINVEIDNTNSNIQTVSSNASYSGSSNSSAISSLSGSTNTNYTNLSNSANTDYQSNSSRIDKLSGAVSKDETSISNDATSIASNSSSASSLSTAISGLNNTVNTNSSNASNSVSNAISSVNRILGITNKEYNDNNFKNIVYDGNSNNYLDRLQTEINSLANELSLSNSNYKNGSKSPSNSGNHSNNKNNKNILQRMQNMESKMATVLGYNSNIAKKLSSVSTLLNGSKSNTNNNLNSIAGQIGNIDTILAKKADVSDLISSEQALKNAVDTKASLRDVTTAEGKLENDLKTKASKITIKNDVKNIQRTTAGAIHTTLALEPRFVPARYFMSQRHRNLNKVLYQRNSGLLGSTTRDGSIVKAIPRYLQKKHNVVKVTKDCFMYSNKHYSNKSRGKAVKVGQKLHVKAIYHFNHYVTRLQLTNGKWITANKNFVKVI